MKTHNAQPLTPDALTGKSWNEVKGELIGLFGTLSEAARELRCHTNSLRVAVEGDAPGIRARLVVLMARARAKRDAKTLSPAA